MPARLLAWLLAIGFMLLTIFCLQTMSSAYIRALGDKAQEQALGAGQLAVGSKLSAKSYYALSARIDPQNWRAYKGMADLQYKKRYHSIDMSEKMQLAEIERHWYELAYKHNPKDPEIVSSLGKTYIFLSRSQSALRMGQGGPTEGGGQRTEVGDQRESSASLKRAQQVNAKSAESLQPIAHSRQLKAQLIDQGLELLREACRYRKFNDTYWWALGVELRKAGLYEEALQVFHQTEKIKRSASTQMNIKWLQRQLTGQSEIEKPVSDVKDMNLRMESGGIDLPDLLDMMSK